jgi:replication factor C subunit 3/5
MICNYVNKITPALQSRCTKFRFAPLKPNQIIGRLETVIETEKVNTTEEGRNAILQLACGDMRRVLNLLQTTIMAYPEINEETVYLTAGSAIPAVIKTLLNSLLNENFDTSYNLVKKTIHDFGYALCDINTELALLLSTFELPDPVRSHLIDIMSTIEYRLSHGVSEKLQIGTLVGSFVIARHMMNGAK